KSDTEKDELVKKIKAKREAGQAGREVTSFDIPRISSLEKIVLTITSLLLIASLFLPWFSGYHEYEVVSEVAPAEEQAVLVDSLADSLGMEMIDSTALAAEVTGTLEGEAVEEPGEPATPAETETIQAAKDDKGFSSITAARKRKEIRREHLEANALAALPMLGKVLSSGFILKITGILFLIYILFCVGGGFYNLYALYWFKGDPDTRAMKLKKVMKFAWIPVGIWALCLILSFVGASYSFDTTDVIKQIGTSYGTGAYLGILSYGFYLSLACFILNAVKAVEI
ncbi:MAG: hypothetical protein DRP46_13585, partial [Candidatus Zixiibacteriota bacterium]